MNPQMRSRVHELAASQGGVVSRTQLVALGLAYSTISNELAARRWVAHGLHAIAVHALPLDDVGRMHVAVWEASSTAVLDGSSSLAAAGLTGYNDGLHLLAQWPNGGRSWGGSIVHGSRLWNEADFVPFAGVRRTRNPVAVVRGAMWARSDRAAATLMFTAVQQRITTSHEVLTEAHRLNRHRRRPFIVDVAGHMTNGVHALGEFDFSRLCRARNLPEPSRQVVRVGPLGRAYKDVEWKDYGVVVEIEGVHHDSPDNMLPDSLRQNSFTIAGDAVLRIPVLGLRLMEDEFMLQVRSMLERRGWRRSA